MLDIGSEVAFSGRLDEWGLPITRLLRPEFLDSPYAQRGKVIYFIPAKEQIAVMDRRRHVWKIKLDGAAAY